jgi:Putative addiction module component
MLNAAFEIQALSLPLSDRAELASKLIASLDNMQEGETESLWLDVAQDRATQLDSNPSFGISFEHSDAKLRAILARQP